VKARAGTGAILGMKLFLPKTDGVGGRGRGKAKKRFEALGPGESAGG